MLREVFRSAVIPYDMSNKESIVRFPAALHGMVVGIYPTQDSTNSIYVWAILAAQRTSIGGIFAYYRFSGKTGRFVSRMPIASNLGMIFNLGLVVQASRRGQPWSKHYYQNELIKLNLGVTATAYPGDEPKKATSLNFGPESSNIPVGHFTRPDGSQAMFGFGSGFVIDEIQDRFIDGNANDLKVFTLSTGKMAYEMKFPDNIAALCFEDNDHVFILMGSRTVVLFDYIRGEVLGASKIPKLLTRGSYWIREVPSTWRGIGSPADCWSLNKRLIIPMAHPRRIFVGFGWCQSPCD